MMKSSIIKLLTGSIFAILFVLCEQASATNIENNESKVQKDSVETILPISTVMTAEKRATLSPLDIVELLKKGNKDYSEDNLTILNTSQRIRDAVIGQYPVAAVLSCIDSRVPVEDVFHLGIGDVFVARIAGNIVDEDILGSLEYSTKVAGAKVLLVLGHEYCGAIKSAISNVEMGNITALLDKIKPAINIASENFEGKKDASNPKFVEAVCDDNVENSIVQIRENSSIIREMEEKGELIIMGGVYDIKTGIVDFLEKK